MQQWSRWSHSHLSLQASSRLNPPTGWRKLEPEEEEEMTRREKEKAKRGGILEDYNNRQHAIRILFIEDVQSTVYIVHLHSQV